MFEGRRDGRLQCALGFPTGAPSGCRHLGGGGCSLATNSSSWRRQRRRRDRALCCGCLLRTSLAEITELVPHGFLPAEQTSAAVLGREPEPNESGECHDRRRRFLCLLMVSNLRTSRERVHSHLRRRTHQGTAMDAAAGARRRPPSRVTFTPESLHPEALSPP